MIEGAAPGVVAREAMHMHILQELVDARGVDFVLKGGVNLRLFFGSVRYSKDIELDGAAEDAMRIKSAIRRVIEQGAIPPTLKALGIRDIDPGQGPNKDTDTTYRYKFNVVAGGIGYDTKVDVSFRDRESADPVEVAAPDERLVHRYLGDGAELLVPHYERLAAVRQKVEALASPNRNQARDILDLHALGVGSENEALESFVGRTVDGDHLLAAIDRTFELSYSNFTGQVVEFLGDDAREQFASDGAWARLRLGAVDFIERALNRQGAVES